MSECDAMRGLQQRLARGMSRWSVILGWDDWAVGSRVPKGAAPPPLGCAEDTQKSLLASAGELRCEQNGEDRMCPDEAGRTRDGEAGSTWIN